jgi:holo-[acyl-carrier protein] synthase
MKPRKQKNIYGIGVDIVEVSRITEKLRRSYNLGEEHKFAKKILTNSEFVLYLAIEKVSERARFVSKCWAVKEAFVKALGTGFTGDFHWGDIAYVSPGNVRPTVQLSDRAHYNSLMKNKTIHLSVSDEITTVIAYVTIEEET